MSGRLIPSESDLLKKGHVFGRRDFIRRRAVLRETITVFLNAEPPDQYHQLAAVNLERWQNERRVLDSSRKVLVLPSDWGVVAHALTKRYGVCFAVLNMANAYVPGGGYVEGAPAQEENMFRRTDCHFSVGPDVYDAALNRYFPKVTKLISAKDGIVYLDIRRPRVCIRGPEDRSRDDLGYSWLAVNEVFPFFELRAAAQDLRDNSPFDFEEARRRIAAQLDTLRMKQVQHVVLGAFGCGAFRNPAVHVAKLYKEEIEKRIADFSVIAFAIFGSGYGPDNFAPFNEVFSEYREVN